MPGTVQCLKTLKKIKTPALANNASRPVKRFLAAGAGADIETAIDQAPSVLYISFVL